MLVVQLAFWRFEPAQAGETRWVPLLVGLAAMGALGVLLAVARLARASCATRLVAPALARGGDAGGDSGVARPRLDRVDSAFPVVAVVGVWRPELFVASHVVRRLHPG